MKKWIAAMLALILCMSMTSAMALTDGTYEAEAQGFGGTVKVVLTVAGDKITDVAVTGDKETPGIGSNAIEQLPAKIMETGSAQIDGVAGATLTSNAIKEAAAAALAAANGEVIPADEGKIIPGTYTATVNGMNGPITLEVILSETGIESVSATEHMETPGIGSTAMPMLFDMMIAQQTPNVDTISGATVTSAAVRNAVKSILKDAGAGTAMLNKPYERATETDAEYTADVVIVGAGGAGLAASIRALEQGASVILIEKTAQVGGNSIVAGGFINIPDPATQDLYQAERSPSLESLITAALDEEPVSEKHKELQDIVRAEYEEYLASDKTLFDSVNWHALQTWNGGDKIGDLDIVTTLTRNAPAAYQWLKDLGQEFKTQVLLGGGALYPRSHYAALPNGTGYIGALMNGLEGKENFTLLFNTDADSLIMDGEKVVGVNATGRDGNKVTLHANKGVILATGGFAGNVELRERFCEGEKWPELGPVVCTTNVSGVTGDGIFMAEAAGANLVNMEQLQMLPYCNPQTGYMNDCVDGFIHVFLNKEGNRFVREDGRRDEMSKGILDQTDSVMYCCMKYEGALEDMKSLAGQPLTYLLDAGVSEYTYAANIDDLAAKLNLPLENVRAAFANFDEHAASQTADEFGRVSFPDSFGDCPFIAWARRPAAHHTMGGVEIDTEAHALRADGTIVPGLYCAGEITGVVHGGNRIGGNAIVDFLVYGQIAGTNAALGK